GRRQASLPLSPRLLRPSGAAHTCPRLPTLVATRHPDGLPRDLSPPSLQYHLVEMLRPLLERHPLFLKLRPREARLVGLRHAGLRRNGVIEDPVHNLRIYPDLRHPRSDGSPDVPHFKIDSAVLPKSDSRTARTRHGTVAARAREDERRVSRER